jgi:hypothetical protein
MKMPRPVALMTLLATLAVSSAAVTAEERGSPVLTSVSSTSISGYVDTTIIIRVSSQPQAPGLEQIGWWQQVLLRFGFHPRFSARR